MTRFMSFIHNSVMLIKMFSMKTLQIMTPVPGIIVVKPEKEKQK